MQPRYIDNFLDHHHRCTEAARKLSSDHSCNDDHHDDHSQANDQSGDISTHTPTYCHDDLSLATSEGMQLC